MSPLMTPGVLNYEAPARGFRSGHLIPARCRWCGAPTRAVRGPVFLGAVLCTGDCDGPLGKGADAEA